jgi:hypothetical protein
VTKQKEEEVKQFTDIVKPAEGAFEPVTPESKMEIQSDFIKSIGDEMSKIGLENLKKLCLQNEYNIGDKTFTGKKLRPKDIKDISKLEKDFEELTKGKDAGFIAEQELAVLQAKAYIHLGMIPEEFEETDIPLLTSIVTARDLRMKGWFRIQ